MHFTSALWRARQWTDSTHGRASPAGGQPPPAAVADNGVAARHCRGNGSGAVGRDTITDDRERHVQRRRRRRLCKVCDADASIRSIQNTRCCVCESRARGTQVHMFAGTPRRFVAVENLKNLNLPSFTRLYRLVSPDPLVAGRLVVVLNLIRGPEGGQAAPGSMAEKGCNLQPASEGGGHAEGLPALGWDDSFKREANRVMDQRRLATLQLLHSISLLLIDLKNAASRSRPKHLGLSPIATKLTRHGVRVLEVADRARSAMAPGSDPKLWPVHYQSRNLSDGKDS